MDEPARRTGGRRGSPPGVASPDVYGNIVVKLKTFFNGKLVSDTANPKSVMPERVYLIFDAEVARLMADNVVVRKMLPVASADFEEGVQSKN